jgi:(p)ppGpp synthase/HD superfamily hydrolase
MMERDDRYAYQKFTIDVKDRIHLANVIRKIRSIKSVSQITRV